MFTIKNFDGQEKVVENIDTIKKFGGNTQLRIHDISTGIFSRILPQTDGKYTLAESGISPRGFLSQLYGITEDLDIDDDSIELYDQVLSEINRLNLTSDEVDNLLTNGFLHTIEQKNPETNFIRGFKEILAAEQLAYEIEQNGCFAYQNVLDEINRRIGIENITDDERKALVALKNVYENDLFRQSKENSNILKEKQKINDELHSAEEITEDLLEIGKSTDKEDALHELVETKEEQSITYNLLGGNITKEELISAIEEKTAVDFYDIVDIIVKDADIRKLVLQQLSEMSKEEIEEYGYNTLLDDITHRLEAEEERN